MERSWLLSLGPRKRVCIRNPESSLKRNLTSCIAPIVRLNKLVLIVVFLEASAKALDQRDHRFLLHPASSVPLPAAFYVFGSSLIGLIGIARRRKA